ncbi:MAG: metallophosphoesterase family protein [Vicinamibacteria bacterium]
MLGIISDIHGNHPALEAVLRRLDELGATDIVCLGDTAGYYSQVNECCDTLRAREVTSVMGNHDWYLTRGEPCPRSKSANDCLDYQHQVVTPENLAWLGALPVRATKRGISIVHGGWNDPLDEYLVPTTAYFEGLPGDLFASGHTHVPTIWSQEGKTYCNPGSVGQPRDGDPRASFGTWNGAAFALHRIDYDVDLTRAAMARAGFDPYYSDNLVRGTQIGGRISSLVTSAT